jgi:protein TonB
MMDENQRQAAQQAADAWLKLMDEGKASESWEAAAQGLKAKVSKESWERHQRYFAEQAKEQWIIKSRKLKKAAFVKSLPSTRGQEGIVLEYESTLENAGPVTESVELVLEHDQMWRVAMYKVIRIPANPEPGGGLGSGKGGGIGIGSGDGTGFGPGTGFNTGGGNPRPDPNAPATTVDQKPIPLTNPSPHYTEEARKNKIQGNVRVRVLVGADGSVKQVRMVRGLPDGLEDEAIREAYKMRFKPAMKGGQPVAFWVPIDIEFNLR